MEGAICVHSDATGGGGSGGQDRTIRKYPREQRAGNAIRLALQVHLSTLMNGNFSVAGQLHSRGACPHLQGG